jgi:hypothetical protein
MDGGTEVGPACASKHDNCESANVLYSNREITVSSGLQTRRRFASSHHDGLQQSRDLAASDRRAAPARRARRG